MLRDGDSWIRSGEHRCIMGMNAWNLLKLMGRYK